jgi:hypothetical protein
MSASEEIGNDKLVRTFIKIRDRRKAIKASFEDEDTDLKAKLRLVENELLRRAQDGKMTTFTTESGTAYRSEDKHVSIADPDDFKDFLADAEDPYLFYEQRPALGRILEYQKAHDGELPPGIKMFREFRMRVRATKKKGAADDDRSDD